MNPDPLSPTTDSAQPTQHGLLVCWGEFARELGLVEQLHTVPIPSKIRLGSSSTGGAEGHGIP
jgi:hypothetical protein